MKKKKQRIISLFLLGCLLLPYNTSALSKSETIYTKLNAEGKVQSSSVTNHLAFLKEKEETDDTTLKEILNINGKESYRIDGNKLIWENNGKDIFYKGTTENLLPIEVKVDYYLDGKKKNPKKMIGKKGTVTIHFQFTNRNEEEITVGNRQEKVYTPFVVSLGTILDGKANQDFTIDHGKIISTGTRNIVLGVASPGLYESTKLKSFQSLDEVTLTYKTSKFSLQNIYIVATPKLLAEEDLNVFDEVDHLYQNMQSLDDNMKKLTSGATELADGTMKLYDGSSFLSSNMKKMDSAIRELQTGSITLEQGLIQLKDALVSVQKMMEGKDISASLSQIAYLRTQNEGAIQGFVSQTGMDEATLRQFYNDHNLSSYQPTGVEDTLGKIKSAYELISLLRANNSALEQMTTVLTNLSSEINALLTELNSNVSLLADGSSKLSLGLSTLGQGSKQLYQGTTQLEDGIRQLVEGSNSLKSGAEAFHQQGIQKLLNYSNLAKNYSNKLEALIDLSKNYKGFASNNSDSTLFVYTISSLKK